MIILLMTILFLGALPSTTDLAPQKNEVVIEEQTAYYMECTKLFPSQLRYSSKNVEAKVNEILRNESARWDEMKKVWVLSHDSGNSALSLDECIPIVKGPSGYYLCDGHHHALASYQLGARTIPVKVIADLSMHCELAFWEQMEKRGWAYPFNILGERETPPKDFRLLQDDPNRYFAALIARKCAADFETSRGAEYPVWIKVGKDIPFIEFQISDALWKQGLRYEYSMGAHPSDEFIEESRRILKEAHIPGLRLVPERLHYSELQLSHTTNLQSD